MLNKIRIQLVVNDDFPPVDAETLLGERLTEDAFKIKNIPFYFNDINLNDIVLMERSKKSEEEILYEFIKVVKHSGNRTLRVIFLTKDKLYRKKCIADLEKLNCSWESMKEDCFMALSVPKEAILDKVLNLMDYGFSKGFIDYQFV